MCCCVGELVDILLGSLFLQSLMTLVLNGLRKEGRSGPNLVLNSIKHYKSQRSTDLLKVWNRMCWYYWCFLPCVKCQWNQPSITECFDRTKCWHRLQYCLCSFDTHHSNEHEGAELIALNSDPCWPLVIHRCRQVHWYYRKLPLPFLLVFLQI